MKKTHLAILAILAIVLALTSSQLFAQVALARSYEDAYNPRLYAGFGVTGTATWSTPGLTRYKSNDAISKTYFDNSTGDCTINEWGIAGRWYVCRYNPTKGFIIADVASSSDVITTEVDTSFTFGVFEINHSFFISGSFFVEGSNIEFAF